MQRRVTALEENAPHSQTAKMNNHQATAEQLYASWLDASSKLPQDMLWDCGVANRKMKIAGLYVREESEQLYMTFYVDEHWASKVCRPLSEWNKPFDIAQWAPLAQVITNPTIDYEEGMDSREYLGLIRPDTKWRHYKGGIYAFQYACYDEADGKIIVVYKDEKGIPFGRPVSEWRQKIDWQGQKVQRFTVV